MDAVEAGPRVKTDCELCLLWRAFICVRFLSAQASTIHSRCARVIFERGPHSKITKAHQLSRLPIIKFDELATKVNLSLLAFTTAL